ncbi:helix-turn-helix transcriptional regulator [Sphingobium yanoikuyae]
MIGLSRSTIYDSMSRGLFPRPLRIGRKAVGWRHSDISEWLNRRERSFGW